MKRKLFMIYFPSLASAAPVCVNGVKILSQYFFDKSFIPVDCVRVSFTRCLLSRVTLHDIASERQWERKRWRSIAMILTTVNIHANMHSH